MNKNSLFRRFFSLTAILFSGIMFVETVATSQIVSSEPQNSNKYSDRGDRMEGTNPPRDVAGPDIQIKAALRLPPISGEITETDWIHLSFDTTGQGAFDVSVSELKSNYLMRPKTTEVTDGEFAWPTSEVLAAVARQKEIGYQDLLPLATTPESTPRLAYVAPVRLSISKTDFDSEGYRFICVSNADVEAVFTIQKDSLTVRRGYLQERAGNPFSIEWDGQYNGKPIEAGEYVLHVRGEASSNATHVSVESTFFFHHGR